MGFEPTCTALQAAASPLGHSTRDSNPTSPKTYPSGRRDSNPRPSPWQGDALPLSHVRTAEPRPDLSGVFRRVTDSSRKMGQESKSPQVSALFRRARAASSVVVDGSACGSPRSDRVRDAGGRRGRRPVAPSCRRSFVPARAADRRDGARAHGPRPPRNRRQIVVHPSWAQSDTDARVARSGLEARGVAYGLRGP